MTELRWQDAVATLAAERTRAEAAAKLIKDSAGPDRVAAAELTYGEGKAASDAVIAGLVTALAQRHDAPTLAELEPRLKQAVDTANRLVDEARALATATHNTATKSVVGALLGSVVLVAAVNALRDVYIRRQDGDALRRQTIATQLEATRWRPFTDLSS